MVVEATRQTKLNGYRLISWGRLDPTRCKNGDFGACIGGQGGRTKIQHTLERETGGMAPRDRIWLHQVRERCESKAPNHRCCELSVVSPKTELDMHLPAEPWDLKRMRSGSSRCTESQLEKPGSEPATAYRLGNPCSCIASVGLTSTANKPSMEGHAAWLNLS